MSGRPNTPKVVVVGLDHSVGLQTARIFAQRGITVIGVAREPAHFACRTNVCENILFADTHNDDLVKCLVALGQSLEQKAVLVPCRDLSVWIVSLYRKILEPYFCFLLPPHETVTTLMDKVGFSSLALSKKFSIPKTYLLKDDIDLESALKVMNYPCVIKPGLKTDTWVNATNKKVFKVFSADELADSFNKYRKFSDALIAQEWIEGDDTSLYSCNFYFDHNSEPVVAFVARKIRQWPPHTGETSLGEECRDDNVLKITIDFFKSLQFKGLGYLEMKKDAKDGQYYLIEANIGRPTGRSALAEASGVELLYSMYCDLSGLQIPSTNQQLHRGVKWINLSTDILSSFLLWRHGELTLLEWLKSLRGEKCFAVLSWRDPLPFWAQLTWGLSLLKRKKLPHNLIHLNLSK